MVKQFYFKQFSLARHLFPLSLNIKVHSLNVKQLYLIHRGDPIRCFHSRPEWDLGAMAVKGVLRIPQSPSITAASSSDYLASYPRLVGGVLPLCRYAVGIFYSTSQVGQNNEEWWTIGTDGVCVCVWERERERDLGISLLWVWLDDEDYDIYIYIYIYIYI